jgi:hypothetical protein
VGVRIRYRFVALELAPAWIELRRTGPWVLKHPKHPGELWITMFPVAEGVIVDLPTIQHLEHERRRHADERQERFRNPLFRVPRLLDERSWSVGSLFCLTTKTVRAPSPWPHLAHPAYVGQWTVSDGRYMVEASLHGIDNADDFTVGVADCEAIMRSVRFEGPS